jgi:hypothetical protein
VSIFPEKYHKLLNQAGKIMVLLNLGGKIFPIGFPGIHRNFLKIIFDNKSADAQINSSVINGTT